MVAPTTWPQQQRPRLAKPALGLLLALSASACRPDAAPTWQLSFEADESVGALMSVWGPDSSEVYVVGGQPGDTGFGVAYQFDGDRWADLSLPAGTPMLNWVHGVNEQVLVVGESGTVLRSVDQGVTFTDMSHSGVDDPLWGVWAASENDVWIVGGDPFTKSYVLSHLEGGAWVDYEMPALDRMPSTLFKVWGAASDQVWAVGDTGIVIAWDGQTWSQQLASTSSDLVSLWGTGPNQVAAIGGRANGTLARFDGSTWTSEVLAGLPGMNGMWMDSSGEALIGGVFGTLAHLPANSASFEAQEFTLNPLVIHAVYGFEDGSRFAVAGSLDRSPPYVGAIAQLTP